MTKKIYNVCLYENLESTFKNDKKIFKQVLNIHTKYIDKSKNELKNVKSKIDSYFDGDGNEHHIIGNINSKENPEDCNISLIDRIYDYCYREAYSYSWKFLIENSGKSHNETFEDMVKGYNSVYNLSKVEELIKEHCIIVALYTTQYLLNKDKTVSVKDLSDIKSMGYNHYNNNKKDCIEDKYTSTKINNVCKEIKTLKDNNKLKSSYLGLMFSENNNEIYTKEKNSRVLPLFLSNISYSLANNFGSFETYELINEIKKIDPDNVKKIQIKKESFINEYLKCINNFSSDYDNSTNIDKILFYYKKELIFGYKIIKRYFVDEINDSEHFLSKKRNVDLIKECMMLPNEFSKIDFLELFNEDTRNFFRNDTELIRKLRTVIIPTFEKLFFITLYNYIVRNHKTNIIQNMNDELIRYFVNSNDVIINTRIASYIKQCENENKPISVNNIKYDYNKEIKGTEKIRILYDILENTFTKMKNNYSTEISEIDYSYINNLNFDSFNKFDKYF